MKRRFYLRRFNMQLLDILDDYPRFIAAELNHRFFKHSDLKILLDRLPADFQQSVAGKSFEGRELSLVQWGDGKTKVFLWSQMHGDEATGTMALFDLFNFLQKEAYKPWVDAIRKSCTLYFLPMVNPDGAERFTRRNAQQIDINRDFRHLVSPEAVLLKALRDQITPDFGFNLHDQSTLWSVKHTGMPATLSYLAPAYNEALEVNESRAKAMLVIADMYQTLDQVLPGQIGLFDDEYEVRAFGDNFQAAGTSTILIEAGGYANDADKQSIRRYYFLSILSALASISNGQYTDRRLEEYFGVPKNTKELFHILIKDINHAGTRMSIGLNYEEVPGPNVRSTEKCYLVQDMGDLDHLHGYLVYEGGDLRLEGNVVFDKPANFSLFKGAQRIMSFTNGVLQSKTIN